MCILLSSLGLRPLSLGEIYDGAFGAIRKAPGSLLGLTSLIVGFFVALAVIVGYANMIIKKAQDGFFA